MFLITAVAFLFILGFSITIHEIGHFLFAKIFRIPVEKFSIGFGPPVIRKKIGETDFRIAWVPVGGYVKMAGEEDAEVPLKSGTELTENQPPGFYDAPLFHRIMVVLSGPVFNIVSGAIVLFLLYAFFGIYVNPHMRIRVKSGSYAERVGFKDRDSLISVNGRVVHYWDEFAEALYTKKDSVYRIALKRDGEIIQMSMTVNPDSLTLDSYIPPVVGSLKIDGPAHKAGLANNDTIVSINDKEIKTWDDFVSIVRSSKNTPINIVWRRKGELISSVVTPAPYYDPILQDTVGQVGIVMLLKRIQIGPGQAVIMALDRTVELILFTLKTFYQLIKGEISRKALGGPIAIAKLTGESARWGLEYLINLLSVISINLGLVNLFPIPALDGGHIIIALIEGIRRKRFSKKTRLVIQQIGFAIIIILIIYVTFNDLTR